MKPSIILMSHGKMAEETLHSAQMIVGDLADAQVISMDDHDGLSGTKQKLEQALNNIAAESSVLVIADLKGGTPCNVAMMKMKERKNMRVISGLNLAMVIEASVSVIDEVDELVQYLIPIGKEAVTAIELPEIESEEEYED